MEGYEGIEGDRYGYRHDGDCEDPQIDILDAQV